MIYQFFNKFSYRIFYSFFIGSTVRLLVDNFGDENTLPRLKLSIRKTAKEDFVDLNDPLSNASPLY